MATDQGEVQVRLGKITDNGRMIRVTWLSLSEIANLVDWYVIEQYTTTRRFNGEHWQYTAS